MGKGWKGSSGYGVKKKWQPKTLIDQIGKTRKRVTKRTKRPFFIKGKGGMPILAIRKGKGKKGQIHFLYSYVNKANVRPRWEFEETADKYVRRAYATVLKKEWNRMMRGM